MSFHKVNPRRALILSFIFVFLLVPVTSFAANEAENVTTVVNYIDHIISNHQFKWAEKLVHPDGMIHRILGHPEHHDGTFRSLDQIEEFYQSYEVKLTPMGKRIILDIAADGEVVFVHYAVTGTGPESNDIGYRVTQLFKLEGGKITRRVSSLNPSYVLPQRQGETDGTPPVDPEKTDLVQIQPPKSPQNESANVARVLEYYNAREENRVAEVEDSFHEEFGIVASPPKEPLPGFDKLLKTTKGDHKRLEDVDIEILDIAADGDDVFVHTLTTGKVKESGKDYELEELIHFEFVDGKIHRVYSYTDREYFEIIS